MNWTKERQRWFNLVLMNAVAVKVWHSQRNKFNTDQLWFLTLPVFLIFFNGIFFAPTIFQSAVAAGDVRTTAGTQIIRFPWRTNAVIFIALGLFLTCGFLFNRTDLVRDVGPKANLLHGAA